jgi:hypothetical protein
MTSAVFFILQTLLYSFRTDNIENTAYIAEETCLLLIAQQWKALCLLLASNGNSSSASSRNLTPDLQGYTDPWLLGSLVSWSLSQCPLGSPSLFHPDTLLHKALACYLLAHLYDASLPFPHY